MQFVYPTFLWALAAVGIPVIIHLFHFRRYKKIVFSDIRFLKQLQEQNKSKQKLRDILVLICRMLAIAAIVVAFAQPFIPVGESASGAPKNISLFVDNSFSMNAEGEEGPLLEMAKSKARAIVEAYGNNDQFQILTNNLSGSEQRLVNKTEAIARIDAIVPVFASASMDEITARQQSALANAGEQQRAAYFISDFQASQFKFNRVTADSLLRYHFIPVQNKQAVNVSVDSVYLLTPFVKSGEAINLQIRLTNHGAEAIEGAVAKVSLNGVQKALLNLNMGAGETITSVASITPSNSEWQQGEVSVTDYPITFDDKLYFAFKPVSRYRVLYIGKGNKYIHAVFGDDAGYELTETSQGNINYQALSQYQLLILDEPTEITSGMALELDKYLQQNGQLLLVPGEEISTSVLSFATQHQLPSFGSLMEQKLRVAAINIKHPLFKGVFKKVSENQDMPTVSKHYPLQKQSNTRGEGIITLNNGSELLWYTPTGKGNIYQLAVPLQDGFSNLQMHSVFVPMMLNMSMGATKGAPLYMVIGRNKQLVLPGEATPEQKLLRIGNKQQELVTELMQLQGQKVIPVDAINTPGWFDVTEKGNNKIIAVAAFNSNRQESSMRFLEADELKKQTSSWMFADVMDGEARVLKAQISEQLSGKTFWRWFIWAALLFICAEIVLLRVMR